MKAVILAAGRGTRMGHLTDNIPKGLLSYRGKPLLEYTFATLPRECSEIIVVTGYLGHQIASHFGKLWNSIPVRYVSQIELNGTAGALWLARPFLQGESFLVLPCDDIFTSVDLESLCGNESALLAAEVRDREASGGLIKMAGDGSLISITEGQHSPPCLIATGAYFLKSTLFDFQPVKIEGRSEFGIPQTVVEYSRRYPLHVHIASNWKQIVGPDDLI